MKKLITGALLMGPMFAFAQAATGNFQGSGFYNFLKYINGAIAYLIPLLLAIAVLLFFWGLVKYIANASDEAAKEEGKTLMIWGMVALFVMVAFWGIIGFVVNSLGLSQAPTPVAGPTNIVGILGS